MMSSDSSRLWDFGHQVSTFLASLSGGSSPAKSFLLNTYIPEKVNSRTPTVYKLDLHPINSFICSRCMSIYLLSKYPQFI